MQSLDMRIKDVTKITGYAPASLRALARKGRLPGSYKFGGRWFVNREILEQHRNGEYTRFDNTEKAHDAMQVSKPGKGVQSAS